MILCALSCAFVAPIVVLIGTLLKDGHCDSLLAVTMSFFSKTQNEAKLGDSPDVEIYDVQIGGILQCGLLCWGQSLNVQSPQNGCLH